MPRLQNLCFTKLNFYENYVKIIGAGQAPVRDLRFRLPVLRGYCEAGVKGRRKGPRLKLLPIFGNKSKYKTMNVETFRVYCLSKKGITEEFPFDEETLVFKVMGKMFALCGLEHVPFQIALKCDPERAIELREQYDGRITEAWHMSKKHWNSVHAEALPEAL